MWIAHCPGATYICFLREIHSGYLIQAFSEARGHLSLTLDILQAKGAVGLGMDSFVACFLIRLQIQSVPLEGTRTGKTEGGR